MKGMKKSQLPKSLSARVNVEEESSLKEKELHVSSFLIEAGLYQKLTGVEAICNAHQLFGERLIPERRQQQKRKYHKDWKFKFRGKNLGIRSCYYTNGHKHKASTKEIRRPRRKKKKYSKSCHFNYKSKQVIVDAYQLFNKMLLRRVEKHKKMLLKIWKFKFKDVSKRRVYGDVGLAVGFCTVKHTWSSKFKIMVIWVEVESSEEGIAYFETQQQWLFQILLGDQLHYRLKMQIFTKDWFFKYKHDT